MGRTGLRTYWRDRQRALAEGLRPPFLSWLRDYRLWHSTYLRRGQTPIGRALPWLAIPAVRWLQRTMRPDMRIFEWGTGGSTLFFARYRPAQLVSVEHHGEWHQRVADAMREHEASINWESHLVPPADGVSDCEPEYRSASADYPDGCFRDYCRVIDSYPRDHFDLVLIDGRARNGCFLAAADHVRPGGWIIWDDSHRATYQLPASGFERIDHVGMAAFSGNITRATSLRRIG